jgi:hypothetical protein
MITKTSLQHPTVIKNIIVAMNHTVRLKQDYFVYNKKGKPYLVIRYRYNRFSVMPVTNRYPMFYLRDLVTKTLEKHNSIAIRKLAAKIV